ncbi:hypothetical protein [Nonomuraea sediminis]|uniref:hypothetical protein n=1 Tax=Nonomuraea sediminis TaxID=2835864 RepID=UPI001BDBE807|nr:hypothetical protein [Nonomuraea sediminis]
MNFARLTVAWSIMYGALGIAWALGLPGFPWGRTDPDPDGALSILAALTPTPGGWWIAATCALTAALALTLPKTPTPEPTTDTASTVAATSAGGRVSVGLGMAWVMAAFLVVVVPDSRLMMGVAYTPVFLFVAPFVDGPWGELTLADLWPWPVLNQLLCVLGGILLAAAALRSSRSAPGRWTTPGSAARWGRWAVTVAVATPLLYCATRWSWALGIPLGITRDFLEQSAKEAPGIWMAGAYLATFGALGGLLTLGLTQRWGEIFPRWIPGLRGKRVPPLLAIVPATFVSIIITVAGLTYLRRALSGMWSWDSWGAWFPECFWPVWGTALAAATLAYHLRRRA